MAYVDLFMSADTPPHQTSSPEEEQSPAARLRALKFPHPSSYASKAAFLDACQSWKRQVRSVMNSVILPVPAVSYFYRPKAPTHLESGRLNGRFVYNLGSLPAAGLNYKLVLDTVYDGRVFNEREPFLVQAHNARVMALGDQITGEDQWQAQMFTPEPLPFMYNDFEEYEEAYRDWRREAQECARIEIRHPSRLKYRVVGDKAKAKIPVIVSCSSYSRMFWNAESGESLVGDIVRFDWAKKLSEPSCMKRVQSKLRKVLRRTVKVDSAKAEECENDVCVVGVDKRTFVEDFCYYGVHYEAFNSDRPVHPRVLQVTYGVGSFDELDITARSLPGLLARIENAIGSFLVVRPALLSAIDGELLEFLCAWERVDVLYQLAKVFAKPHRENICVIRPPRGISDDVMVSLVNIYYLSVLLECTNDRPQESLTRAASSKSRQLYLFVARSLTDRHCSELWDALVKNNSSGLATVMFMVACIPSQRLKGMIVAPEFLVRVNHVSQFQCGQIFLQLLLSHDNGELISSLREQPEEIIVQCLSKMTDFVMSLLSGFISGFGSWLLSSHLSYEHSFLLSLAYEAAQLDVLHYHKILYEAGKILARRELVASFDVPAYQERLDSITSHIAEAISNSTDNLEVLLKTVIPYLAVMTCAQQLKECPNCLSTISRNLSSEDRITSLASWKCVRKLCMFPSIAMAILTSPDFASAIGTCYNSTDSVVLRKVLQFTIRRFRSTIEVRTLMCEVLVPIVGALACLVTAAPTRFDSAPRVLASIDEFVLWISQNTEWRISKLILQHMGENTRAFYDRVPKQLSF